MGTGSLQTRTSDSRRGQRQELATKGVGCTSGTEEDRAQSPVVEEGWRVLPQFQVNFSVVLLFGMRGLTANNIYSCNDFKW